jgi:hypothetical protein
MPVTQNYFLYNITTVHLCVVYACPRLNFEHFFDKGTQRFEVLLQFAAPVLSTVQYSAVCR